MVYTASDAIDFAYRMIGKISATYLNDRNDNQRFRLLAMDIKELYRSAIKNDVKSESEFERYFNNFPWTFLNNEENSELAISKIKHFMVSLLFVKNDVNFWLNREHVFQELKKIYNLALENSFRKDKETMNWDKNICLIESRFLNFINDKGYAFNDELKPKLRLLLKEFNENEESNYNIKYDLIISNVHKARQFVQEYKKAPNLQNSALQKDFQMSEIALQVFDRLESDNSFDLSYNALEKMIENIPDNAASLDIKTGIEILTKIFYAYYFYEHTNAGRRGLLNSKITFISETGGWGINFDKIEIHNLYIALTYPKNIIEREIVQNNSIFNTDIADVCIKLIALALKEITPDKFSSIDNNVEYEIPNKKIVSIFLYELGQFIKYHNNGGQLNNVSVMKLDQDQETINPLEQKAKSEPLFSIKIASLLLDFEHTSDVISILKEKYPEINNYPDSVIMRTIKFIEKLGEIKVL